MNKQLLTRALWVQINQIPNVSISQEEASAVFDAVMRSITEALVDGEDISLQNFGRLYSHTRKATRKSDPRNPAVILEIPARKTIKFKPSPALVAKVREASSVKVQEAEAFEFV